MELAFEDPAIYIHKDNVLKRWSVSVGKGDDGYDKVGPSPQNILRRALTNIHTPI